MTAQQGPPAPPSPLTLTICLMVAVIGGALVALQARLNGQLGTDLKDGSFAAVISFGTGLVLVLIALAFSKAGRSGITLVRTGIREREIPWFFVLGGFGGALFVLSQGLTVGIIGVALFTVAAVAGQTISGLVIDARGIGTVPPKRVTPARIIGSVIALIAVGISVGPQIQGSVPIWVLLAPLVVGLLLGWQQAVNGQVKTLARSAVTATLFNFLVGTALLLVIAIINVAIIGWPHSFPSDPTLYLGGVIGALFIGSFSIITPIIGVLLQSLAAVAGQLLMSLVLAAIAPTTSGGLGWATIVGTALTLVGVAIATVRRRGNAPSRTTAK